MSAKTLLVALIITISVLFAGIYINDNYVCQTPIILTNITTSQVILDELNTKYTSTTNEFVYCIYGTVDGESAYITDMYLADVVVSDMENILYYSCGDKKDGTRHNYFERIVGYLFGARQSGTDMALGTIHNHPNNMRVMSLQDSYTFGSNYDAIMGVMSGTNIVYLYTPDSLIDGIKLSIK